MTHVARVEVQPEQLVIQLAEAREASRHEGGTGNAAFRSLGKRQHQRGAVRFLCPMEQSPQHARPIRSENRATLVASIARGRRWLDELIADPTATTESIAKRERCSVRKVNMTISLAFLAPDLVKAAIDGAAPAWHGSCPPRRLAGRMVPPAPDARPCSRSSATFEPSLCRTGLRFPGNGISGAETNAPKHAPEYRSCAVAETNAAKKARQLRAFVVSSGNLRVRGTAWWAREDSNLQPSGYEPLALTIELRARATHAPARPGGFIAT